MVRTYVIAQLESLGYTTIAAENGAAALAIVDAGTEFDLLFTDVIMPGGMNGSQLAAAVLARRPRIKALFTSGYTENAIVHHGRLDEGVLLLAKPYRKSDLAQIVRTALDGAAGRRCAQTGDPGPLRRALRLKEHSMPRVLVIDDDEAVCRAIEAVLRRHACVAVVADSGQLGIRLFEASHFDVVMVDIFMPGMDGLEAIKGFRKRAPGVPIIAMPGYTPHRSSAPVPDFLGMASKLGATHCLQKPFTSHQLIAAIDACLDLGTPSDLVA